MRFNLVDPSCEMYLWTLPVQGSLAPFLHLHDTNFVVSKKLRIFWIAHVERIDKRKTLFYQNYHLSKNKKVNEYIYMNRKIDKLINKNVFDDIFLYKSVHLMNTPSSQWFSFLANSKRYDANIDFLYF